MANELSMTEKYTLLMLYGGGNRTDFMACQFTAGIVLGGLFELLQSKYISVGRGNKLVADRKSGTVNECWTTLYDDICGHPAKSLRGWLEYYCFSATYKNIRPVVDDVLNTLAHKGYISITWRRGCSERNDLSQSIRHNPPPSLINLLGAFKTGKTMTRLFSVPKCFCLQMCSKVTSRWVNAGPSNRH